MTLFLNAQLDFIFFLYGLAFILLAAVCFAVTGLPGRTTCFGMLGSFALIHGCSEWLDLIALLVGDTPAFALVRTLLMAASFALLLEFARRQALQLQLKATGPWLYIALALPLVAAAVIGGVGAANAMARYTFGLAGTFATAWVLMRRAGVEPADTRRLWLYAAAGFGLYGVAAGAIVPAANFWPANVVNYASFSAVTGIPIQLVRGVLAGWIAVALWLVWKRMVAVDVDSARYTRAQQHILVWTLAATGTIIVLGWTLTQCLGGIYQRSVEEESAGDIQLLARLLDRETATLGRTADAAGEPDGLRSSPPKAIVAAFKADLSGFNRAYFLVDGDGIVMASNRQDWSLRPLWPLASGSAPAGQNAALNRRPMAPQEIRDATWIYVDGQRHYVRRRFADHSRWSLILLMPDSRVYASRFLGINITLLVSIMIII
jgi:hypothetical protein